MSKYTDDFKLSVINHYLNGSSYHQTAKTFCIDHKQVELWVKLYQVHGIDGIHTRTGKAVYSLYQPNLKTTTQPHKIKEQLINTIQPPILS